MLIALAGLPGTGKSTLSRELARRLGAVWLRIDTVEGAMRRSGLSAAVIGAAGYEVAMAIAGDQLADGHTVVADSVNPVAASRVGWRGVSARAGAPLVEVELVCSDAAEHRRRSETRAAEVPGLEPVGWQAVLDRVYEPWQGERLVVDTAHLSPGAAVDVVMATLSDRSLHA